MASVIILMFMTNGKGISNTISISNTKKITANKKNRREKGIRAVFLGSNPHSNGDFFSRSIFERLDKRVIIIIRAQGKTRAIVAE